MYRHANLNRQSSGQSLTEYAFAGALIVVVCIGVLVLAGGSLVNFGQHYAKETYKATGDKISFFGADTSKLDYNGMGGIVPPPGPGEQQICVGSGYCMNLPSNMTSASYIETHGGNGGGITLAMAQVLSQIAAQMAQDPNADPYLVGLVTQLANQGHNLGNAESGSTQHPWVSDQLNKGWQITMYDNKADYYNESGKSADLMVDQAPDLWAHMQDVSGQHDAFMNLLDAYNSYTAQNPNAMPPDLHAVVQMEAEEIDNLAFDSFYVDDLGPMLNPVDASAITHQDSNDICSTKGVGCIQ